MPTEKKRAFVDLRRELADWHDEEASFQIEAIAAACALIAYADGGVRPLQRDSMAKSLSRLGLIDDQSRKELLVAFDHATARFEIDFCRRRSHRDGYAHAPAKERSLFPHARRDLSQNWRGRRPL